MIKKTTSYLENAFLGRTDRWMYWLVFISLFGFFGLNLLASFLIDSQELIKNQIAIKGEIYFLTESLFFFAIFLVALLLWVRYVHQLSLVKFTTTRKKIDWKRFFFSFFLWGGITTLMVLIDYFLSPQDYQWNFQLKPFLLLALVAILLVPLQTSFEEYFFRGYLMQGIGVMVKNRWLPLIVSSVLFGLVHLGNPEIGKIGYIILIYYIGTGFLLGIMTLMDEGLELALGFHAANNLFTALLVTANWTAFQTPSVLKDISTPQVLTDVFIPILFLYPILLFIFAKKYQWKHWKTKLLGKLKPLNQTENNDTNVR